MKIIYESKRSCLNIWMNSNAKLSDEPYYWLDIDKKNPDYKHFCDKIFVPEDAKLNIRRFFRANDLSEVTADVLIYDDKRPFIYARKTSVYDQESKMIIQRYSLHPDSSIFTELQLKLGVVSKDDLIAVTAKTGDLMIAMPVKNNDRIKYKIRAANTPQTVDFLTEFKKLFHMDISFHISYLDILFENKDSFFIEAMTVPLKYVPMLLNHYSAEVHCIAMWRIKHEV